MESTIEFKKRTPQRNLSSIVEGTRLRDCNVFVFQVPFKEEEEGKRLLNDLKEVQKRLLVLNGDCAEEMQSTFKTNKEMGLMVLVTHFKNSHWVDPQ